MALEIDIGSIGEQEFRFVDTVLKRTPRDLDTWYKYQEKIRLQKEKQREETKALSQVYSAFKTFGFKADPIINEFKKFWRIFNFIAAIRRVLNTLDVLRASPENKKYYDEVITKKDSLNKLRLKEWALTEQIKRQNVKQSFSGSLLARLISILTAIPGMMALLRALSFLISPLANLLKRLGRWIAKKLGNFADRVKRWLSRRKWIPTIFRILKKLLSGLARKILGFLVLNVYMRIAMKFRDWKTKIGEAWKKLKTKYLSKITARIITALQTLKTRAKNFGLKVVGIVATSKFAAAVGKLIKKISTGRLRAALSQISAKMMRRIGSITSKIKALAVKLGKSTNIILGLITAGELTLDYREHLESSAEFKQDALKYLEGTVGSKSISVPDIPRTATGGTGGYVEKSGIAMLHKGELVIPRQAVYPKYITINIGTRRIHDNNEITFLAHEIANKIIRESEW